MKFTFAQSIRSQLEARGPLGAALLPPAAKGISVRKPVRKCGFHYDAARVIAFWQAQGLPVATAEFRFDENRKWRFDFAFPNYSKEIHDENGAVVALIEMQDNVGGLAIEVQGGIFGSGRPCRLCKQRKMLGHNRGSALRKEHEKRNTAAIKVWRILYCEPREVMTPPFADILRQALGIKRKPSSPSVRTR